MNRLILPQIPAAVTIVASAAFLVVVVPTMAATWNRPVARAVAVPSPTGPGHGGPHVGTLVPMVELTPLRQQRPGAGPFLRDPFRLSPPAASPDGRTPILAAAPIVAAAAAPSPPVSPLLLAGIVGESTDTAAVRTAVFMQGDAVSYATTGSVTGGCCVVESIGADSVVLVDQRDGSRLTMTLR